MTGRFADIAAAADAVADLAANLGLTSDTLVVAVVPDAAVVGIAVARRISADLGWVALGAAPDGSPTVVSSQLPTSLARRSVVVALLAVETGQAATAVGDALRALGAARPILLAAVCPREVEPALRSVFGDVHSVVRPLARRAARWHFVDLDPPDVEDALAAIATWRGH